MLLMLFNQLVEPVKKRMGGALTSQEYEWPIQQKQREEQERKERDKKIEQILALSI